MFILEILGSYECLDIVDSKSIIDAAPCAFKFAVLMTYSSANGRERIISFDQFKSVSVFTSRRHIDITLNSYVKGTCGLARCSSCRPCLDNTVLILVVPVPFLFRPEAAVRQLLLRVFNLSVFGAELLSESDRACRTYLYTLTARHALICINIRTISRSRKVRCIEQL